MTPVEVKLSQETQGRIGRRFSASTHTAGEFLSTGVNTCYMFGAAYLSCGDAAKVNLVRMEGYRHPDILRWFLHDHKDQFANDDLHGCVRKSKIRKV